MTATLPVAIDAERQALSAIADASDEHLDGIIIEHVHDAIAVGAALTVRRERGTWKSVDGFRTWEEFCRVRYGINRIQAWRQVRQAKATGELPSGGKPPSQREATKPKRDKPIDVTSTVVPPPAPAPEKPRYDTEGPDPDARPHRGPWTPEGAGWSPLDVLAALLDLDPLGIVADLDPDERRQMAKELRRWTDRFDNAVRGSTPAAPRSEMVTTRLKGQ